MIKDKKLLLVGDYRPCKNFGAIATSTSLITITKKIVGDQNLSIIDQPSFFKEPVPTQFKDFDNHAKKVINGDIMKTEYRLLQDCDAVCVNGEGNIVHNIHNKGGDYRPGARYILFLMYLTTKYFNKPCSIINHIVDPDQEEPKEMIRNIYPLCKDVLVRDPFSVKVLENIGFSKSKYIPDALFSYTVNLSLINKFSKVIDFNKPYVCIGDSASSGYVDWSIKDFYKKMILEIQNRYGQVVLVDGNAPISSDILKKLCDEMQIVRISVENTTFEELASIFAHSRAFVSGRWHASILASLSGTPCVLFGTDSHKTRALHSMTELPSSFYRIEELPNKLNELLYDLDTTLKNEVEIRKKIKLFSEDSKEKTKFYFNTIEDLLK